ncbi:PhzF family phenazine biosynthesis protein [Pseudovibrio sp. Alg231-02]|uniref:PhzF family phenazine biosynthesis protein n=1 Tax=Pseudovibrio sp. Alg231-02 TaxID=1922223 RepID=UPI000D55DEB5|nr:PhzF family phenazine biosynthesis isomerase [Pseudovibrio sp. Alg231-02]
MTKLPIKLYAAFSDGVCGGNTAGVIYDLVDLSPAQMLRIASDIGAPTCAFVRKKNDRTFYVRFFSSTGEMDMCGHATVAAFSALLDDNLIQCNLHTFYQLTKAGKIAIFTDRHDQTASITIQLEVPKFEPINLRGAQFHDSFGLSSNEIKSAYSASASLNHLFVEVSTIDRLSKLQLNHSNILNYSHVNGYDTIGVWCLQQSKSGYIKLRLRDFCHGVGDHEEAASGTTNGALAGLLYQLQFPRDIESEIATVEAEQGHEMNKPCKVLSTVRFSEGKASSIHVTGSASRLQSSYVRL